MGGGQAAPASVIPVAFRFHGERHKSLMNDKRREEVVRDGLRKLSAAFVIARPYSNSFWWRYKSDVAMI